MSRRSRAWHSPGKRHRGLPQPSLPLGGKQLYRSGRHPLQIGFVDDGNLTAAQPEHARGLAPGGRDRCPNNAPIRRLVQPGTLSS
jgi:hypothetical protein